MRKRRTKLKNKELRKLEKFAIEQLKKYVKIHKKHEKDLNYIG